MAVGVVAVPALLFTVMDTTHSLPTYLRRTVSSEAVMYPVDIGYQDLLLDLISQYAVSDVYAVQVNLILQAGAS